MQIKQLARHGVFQLQEAVMDAMVQNQNTGMTGAEISKALGLFRGNQPNDGYVWNALRELENCRKVERRSLPSRKKPSKKSRTRGGKWFLTDETYNLRKP